MEKYKINSLPVAAENCPKPLALASACLLLIAGFSAWVGTPALAMLQLLVSLPPQQTWLISIVLGVLALVLLWRMRHRIAEFVSKCASFSAKTDERYWALACCILGVLLRLAWALAFHGEPVSDGAVYIKLARRLLAGQSYAIGDNRAYWPPGYPFFLLPWLATFANVRVAILVSNVFLFLAGAMGVRALALRLAGPAGSRMAIWLFAVWPNLVTHASVPGKEVILAALLPWVLWLAIRGDDGVHWRPAWQMVCGLFIGAITLVQPAMQLFPAVILVFWAFATRRLWQAFLGTCALLIGMAAVISPWTVRNYEVFGQFVLVSTNGGFGLYGANNPRANGGYYEYWSDEPVFQMAELEADQEAKRLALAWIQAHPLDFAILATKKSARFMGDDAEGAYYSIKRVRAEAPSWVYPLAKALSNAWWLAFWALILASTMELLRRPVPFTLNEVLLVMSFAYSFLMHTIVESSGRYHILQLGILCVLLPILGQAVSRPRLPSNDARVPATYRS